MGHRITVPPGKQLAYASAEARRRWGEQATAWHPKYDVPGGQCWCIVGLCLPDLPDHRWEIYGVGPDFESAFRDAEERGHKSIAP